MLPVLAVAPGARNFGDSTTARERLGVDLQGESKAAVALDPVEDGWPVRAEGGVASLQVGCLVLGLAQK